MQRLGDTGNSLPAYELQPCSLIPLRHIGRVYFWRRTLAQAIAAKGKSFLCCPFPLK